jgi:transposase-like protein
MEHFSPSAEKSQHQPSEAGKIFKDYIVNAVHQAIFATIQEEVSALCGPRHEQNVANREHFRNGSKPGRINVCNTEVEIKKPRVRKATDTNKSTEVNLDIYSLIDNKEGLEEEIAQLLLNGVSTRNIHRVTGEQTGTGKSNASRIFNREMNKELEKFQKRDLSKYNFVVLTIDGICLAKDIWVIVALGICTDGKKIILDFQKGSSENAEVCSDLLSKIKEKGFRAPQRLFCVLDGSAALRSAVLKHFPDAIIQRCLVHKERNLQGYLPRKHYGELAHLFKKLRQAQGENAGREALSDMGKFLENKNDQAKASLEEAGEDLIAFHKLGVSSLLAPTLLNTNIIENCYRNVRNQIEKVTKWNKATKQVDHWMMKSILIIERGFRKVKGHEKLVDLKNILESTEAKK